MDNDFGRQFTDARKAQSISLKEAAEKTKIREEYLVAIEQGCNKFSLPDIYVRGFVKIYAKYLHLDVQKVMRECPIKEFEVLDNASHDGSFATIVDNEKEQKEDSDTVIDDSTRFSDTMRTIKKRCISFCKNKQKLLFAGVAALAIIVTVILISCCHPKRPADNISQELVNKALPTTTQQTLSLVSTGNVRVIVRTKDSSEKIFSGMLEPGEIKKISYEQPIQIFFDKGEYLLINRPDGEQVYPQPGRGGVEIK